MVSSKEVAKEAQVSQTTVSRVMNNPEKVSPKTRKKVLEVIERLQYRPNSIARSLVNRKTYSIALLSGQLHNPFFAETTTSIVNFAKMSQFNVNVHFENFGDNVSVYQDVLNQQVDGIILSSILYHDDVYNELVKQNIPFIMFNRKHKNAGNFVEMDNVQAGKIGAQHLLNYNHYNIAWISGPLTMSTFYGRYKGFKQQLENSKVMVDDSNVLITDTSEEDISKQLLRLLAKKNRPTAIFAATDSIAIYVIDILQRQGYNVPEDISVIGIDNINLSKHSSFQLSTVGINQEKNLGQIAIEYLIDLIEKNETSLGVIQETIETKLFDRGTVKEV